MVFNTLLVGAAVTPCVLETGISHYLNRKPLHEKPTAHISYHAGLNLVRRFLVFASHHTVDEIQAFTQQRVPIPVWVRTEDVPVRDSYISRAAEVLISQLGPTGIEVVGGHKWWQWRREAEPLRAEWLEMRKDYIERKQTSQKCTRSMLYVHGGAYFFGSVDEHRYQVQRHARKLQARVLSPRYRLAPQFPFPCGILDCLATYLQMLEEQSPETIVFAGDSAGGGMVVSLLVILRDQGLPMPAGAVLLSPWVDLTHSFPSVAGDNENDYIPAHGFLHRPSMSWPAPKIDDLRLRAEASNSITYAKELAASSSAAGKETYNGTISSPLVGGQPRVNNNYLSTNVDGKQVEIHQQIQMYTHNLLLSHPLVSPVLQASLGGLPPLCILVGGGEMLRDEQIYLAHKAAAPSQYPTPTESILSQPISQAEAIQRYPPTDVQLQVWDDLCHVAPTLSFTRPAKHMFRSVSQFSAWTLARAQGKPIHILDDDEISIISNDSSDDESSNARSATKTAKSSSFATQRRSTLETQVGKAGDPLPKFENHMIRQRVTRHGEIYPLAPASELPGCNMAPDEIGRIKPGPVRKWMAAQGEWNKRYAKDKRKVQERRAKEAAEGYEGFEGETPPVTALAGRRRKNYTPRIERLKKSKGLAMWSGWGSRHDETTLENEEEREELGRRKTKVENVVPENNSDHTKANGTADETSSTLIPPRDITRQRSASRVRVVSDEGQTGDRAEGPALIAQQSTQRPAIDGQAFPFKLAVPMSGERNASTMTLSNQSGIISLEPDDGQKQPLATQETLPERPGPERFVTASELIAA